MQTVFGSLMPHPLKKKTVTANALTMANKCSGGGGGGGVEGGGTGSELTEP